MKPLKSVGFAGLGLMGSRMAQNLANKGFEVTVWNRTRAKAESLTNVRIAHSPAELASNVDAVCTCVADPRALREVAFGTDGIFSGAARGVLFVDFSTVSPELSKDLASEAEGRGMAYVEAPVTGSKGGAQAGTLVLMVGASPEAFARAEPLFKAVGEKAIHCGPVGAGSQVKLAGNAVIALMLQALSEGMLLTRRAGVDPKKLLEVIAASGFRSPYFDFKGKAILERNFETHFSIDLMFKDLQLFLESAAKSKTPTPTVAAVKEAYALARAAGLGDKDIAATICALEKLTGTQIGE